MTYQEMLTKIYKQSLWAIAVMTISGVFLTDLKFAFNLMLGGLTALVNLRGIVWTMQTLLGTDKARSKILFLSFLRLLVLGLFFVILGIFGFLVPFALLISFSLIFLIIFKEGLITAYKIKKQDTEVNA